MKQKPTGRTSSSEQIIRDIKRKTRKQYSAEEKIRIVLDGLRGEDSIAELCRREGIAQSLYYKWSKDFMEAEKRSAVELLEAAQADAEQLDALLDLTPVLVERWRALVAELESLASNPDVEPGEIDTARSHLHALLGQVTLKPKDGVLWAHPAVKTKGLTEVSPLPLILVAGA